MMEHIYHGCSMNSLMVSYSEGGLTTLRVFTELAEGCPEENKSLHVIMNGGIVRGQQD